MPSEPDTALIIATLTQRIEYLENQLRAICALEPSPEFEKTLQNNLAAIYGFRLGAAIGIARQALTGKRSP